ncbi:MAG TPA: DUF4870 domain-containing protein [Nannocystis sp.]|jgi:uncharacterized Tic20 family protein
MHTAPRPSPAPTGPDSTDRLLAGSAYASSLLGLWLVVPLIIYCVRREQSRFVAYHAMRAMILQCACVALGVLGLVLAMTLLHAPTTPGTVIELGSAVFLLFALLVPALHVVLAVIAMVLAFRGRTNRRALFARTTERILRRDAGVAIE